MKGNTLSVHSAELNGLLFPADWDLSWGKGTWCPLEGSNLIHWAVWEKSFAVCVQDVNYVEK